MIIAHLNALQISVIKCCLPSISEIEWVISPFGASGDENIQNAADLTLINKINFLIYQSGSTMKAKFLESSLPSFWMYTRS